MYEVLIVDDEYYVSMALIRLIDWKALGYHIAGRAENGLDALHMMKKTRIDVLIADICMPKISGLELIESAQRVNPQVQCIVISGYDDFAYAKQALRLGVVNYIRKPVDTAEMTQTLLEIRHRLNVIATRPFSPATKPDAVEAHLVFLNMEQSAQRLLHAPDSEDADADTNRYAIVRLAVRGDIGEKDLERWICQKTGITMDGSALPNLSCAQILPDPLLCIRFILLGDTLGDADIATCADSLLHEMRKMTDSRVLCSYMSHSCTRTELSEGDRLAERALKSLILTQGDILATDGLPEPDPTEREQMTNAMIRFREALTNQSSKDAQLALNTLFTLNYTDADNLEDALRYLYGVINEHRLRYQSESISIARLLTSPNALMYFDTIDALRTAVVQPVLDYFFDNESFLEDRIAVQVQRHIRQNLGDDLRLSTLSSLFYLSPNHLSFLFKKETGYTLSEFIENTRLERARALLCTSGVTVAEVAAQVGYQNAAYFSRVFKKVTGLSPMQYQARYKLG